MAVHKRNAEHTQALVEQGIITGTLAESVKHISESVSVRTVLQLAEYIVDGSYTAAITRATLDRIRQLAVAGKISERTLQAVELRCGASQQRSVARAAGTRRATVARAGSQMKCRTSKRSTPGTGRIGQRWIPVL